MNSRFTLAIVLTLALGAPAMGAVSETVPSITAPPQSAKPAITEGMSAAQANEPVDISSDSARVNENDRLVVLSGNVIAKQGEVTLQADTVTVHYLADASGAPAPTAPGADASHGKIDRLEATGNVVVTRPGEIVKGDAATYKMIDRQILMTGNVVATRDGNVVRGDSLTVDLVKQTIKLQADQQSGRVRAIFTPPAKNAKP